MLCQHDYVAPGMGILLVAHGTRDPRGQEEFQRAATMLRGKLPGAAVEPCYLELASPDVAGGIARLAAGGVREITVVPVLLFAAGHAKQDIPASVAAALRSTSGEVRRVAVRWAEPLDCHPKIVQLSARRFVEACRRGGGNHARPDDLLLIFVGRGTSDAVAVRQVHEFAARRVDVTPVARCDVCFLAAAKPGLEEAMDTARSSGFRHVVVQPHLLFHGRLAEEVRAGVLQLARERCPGEPYWHFAEHLGPEAELVDALLDRIGGALSR